MKNTIVGIIIGVLIAALGFHVWFLWNLKSVVAEDHKVIGEIVSLINQAKQAQSPANTPADEPRE